MVEIVKESVEVQTRFDAQEVLDHIENCGRTCYQSYENKCEGSAERMIRMLIKMGHESVLEHFSITVKMVTDIGAYKDITRHRMASFSIESTRWISYKDGISVIYPYHIKNPEIYAIWLDSMQKMEENYKKMAELGAKPDELRMILPHSTAAEVCMTANIREWRHIFKMRTHKSAHPSVQKIMKMVLSEFRRLGLGVFFEDIEG